MKRTLLPLGMAVLGAALAAHGAPVAQAPTPSPAASASPAGVVDTMPSLPKVKAGAMIEKPVHTLTLDQALERALRDNPGLKIARMQQTEAWWAYKAAGSLPNGQFASNNMGGNNADATSNGRQFDNTLSYTQSFGSFRQTALNGRAAKQNWLVARANARLALVQLIQQVKDGFYAVLTAQLQVQAATENLQMANHVVNVASGRKQHEGVPRIDLLNARVQQATVQQAYIQAVMTLKQSQNALAPMLGLAAEQIVAVQGDAELPDRTQTLAELQAQALQNNPQIEAARSAVEQGETQVKLARALALPSPSLSYTYDVNKTPLYWFGATLAMPLDWGQIKYSVRQQQAVVEERKLALESARLSVNSAVKTAHDNYQLNLLNVQNFRVSVLQPAEDLMKSTQEEYAKGRQPFLQVLVAQQALRQARTQYYQLLLAGHQSLDALEAAVGQASEP